jgi:hypothetical protein
VLGVVLNEVNPRSRKYGYYYNRYYSKYSHYYDEGGKKKRAKEPIGREAPFETGRSSP